jgi:tripartite-type tricarboxylate transporter receptor subunit TctC
MAKVAGISRNKRQRQSAAPITPLRPPRAAGPRCARRARSLPDVPTIEESGVPGFDVSSHFGVLAPRATSRDAVNKLNSTIVQALRTLDLVHQYTGFGVEPVSSSPEPYAQYIRTKIARWKEVVKAARLKPE